MSLTLGSLFNLYRFPTGRRLFAMRRMREVATEAGEAALRDIIDAAIEHDTHTMEMEAEWEGRDRSKARHDAAANDLDTTLDRALSGFADALRSPIKIYGEQSEAGQRAQRTLDALFPSGVVGMALVPYVQEHEKVLNMIALARGALAGAVAELGLTATVEHIAALNARYGAALDTRGPEELTHDRVRAAQEVGQEKMLHAVAWVLSYTGAGSEGDLTARARLLYPVVQQNDAIRDLHHNRKPITDLSPETGEAETAASTEAEEAPASTEAEPEEE